MRKFTLLLILILLTAVPALAEGAAGSITYEFHMPPRGARTLLINNPSGPLELFLMVSGVQDSAVLFSTDGENTERMQTGTAYRIRLPEGKSLYLHNGSEVEEVRGIYNLIIMK